MCSGEGEGLVLVREGLRQLRAAAAGGRLDGEALTALLREAQTCRNEMDAAFTTLVGELDRCERARADGPQERSVLAWLRGELRLADGAAYSQVRLARQLPELPCTAQAFQRGEIGYQHAVTIARTVDRVMTSWGGTSSAIRSAETVLLEEARQQDPASLEVWARDLRHQLDPDELLAEERDQYERRYFTLRRRRDGMSRVEGLLDPEGSTTVKTAMEALLGPPAREDGRTPGQRRADGLVALGRRALDSGELPARGGQKPHLVVVASVETLRGDPGAPAALLDWYWPISQGVGGRPPTGRDSPSGSPREAG